MEIRFIKKVEGNHIISCRRKDGSETWMQISSFFVIHDLCHYAVETELNMQHAFYGMLAAGTNISDFELPKNQRTFDLTDEAIAAEQIVNLLTIEYNQGKMENFIDELHNLYDRNKAGDFLAVINEMQLTAVRNSFESLANQWQGLSEGESILLRY
jgi:hypothetical protein